MKNKKIPSEDELKAQSRKLSIKEGIFASIKMSLGDGYIAPFAIAINTSNALVALLSSITGLLGPLGQIFGSKLMEKHSRKRIVLKTVLIRTFFWILLILLAILFQQQILKGILPLLLLTFFATYVILAGIATPSWFSWQGDIVDEKHRGRWFAKRNLIIGFISATLAITAAFFLDYFKENNWTMFGFIILFGIAFISRLITWPIFKKQYEPKLKLKKGYYFSFSEFLISAPKNNFGKFTIFRALLGFANSITTPLVAIYLLRFLEFNYKTYFIITMAGTIYSLLIMQLWGKLADKYGNYRIICLTSILIPIIPILWILNSSPIYLAIVPPLIGGISWAGFMMTSSNFIYDNVSQQKRGLATSYFNLLIGIGIFLGAGFGAFLIKFLKTDFIEPIILIFIIGALLRMLAVFWYLPKINEIKKTLRFKNAKNLEHIILKEIRPTLAEEAHEIMSIKKYFESK